MREKLNENPLAQAAVIGVLALIVGFMLIKNMGGGGGGGEALPTTAAPSPTGEAAAPAPATTAPATGAPATAPEAGSEPAPATGGNGGAEFTAGKGLPKDVAQAFDDNKVVVLLIVRGSATDDRKVEPMVAALRERKDTAVWIVKAFDVAKYSRIATGVDVQRTPALVVVQPKRLTHGPLPKATVTYGFRGKQNIDQQVEDALYSGPENLSYSPNEVN